ncbi:hypothetical protein ABR39_19695 [Enterobacter genomosp. O]|uniref:hypothetical protein n=1 Tax=Enterobacter genomosp. O TaxID=2364150 RepID=UPI0006432484|nr:hypothetical protein [Enterobacter genomosp. O]KLP52845.1 hypothetical protein ABR39_19695 [Enterobacter genomosp. O]
MDSAKEIARDMLEAIHIDGSGFWGAVAKGFISFPVSAYYLGYDFLDTEHRRMNSDDKFRMARLVKATTFNREIIEKVISVFVDDFTSRVNMEKISVVKNMAGTATGKVVFAQLTGFNLGKAISSRAVEAFFSGSMAGLLLAIGAEVSRAIYTSRYLEGRNPSMYYKLRDMGDLDLLYFLVEDIVNPFEKACEISNVNHEEFNQICKYFFGGL